MSELPPGWARALVDDVASEVRSGFASGKHNAAGEGIAHLRPMNVSRLGEIDLTEVKYVDPAVDDRRLKPGDILFNNTNSPALVGKTALVRQVVGEQAFSNHMTRLRTVPGVVPAFLAAQLHFLWMTGQLSHLITNHVNQASISAKVLSRQVQVVLPPTAEQERIVAAIEEHLSRLDAAEAGMRSAATHLTTMRSSLLEEVTRGDWASRPLGEVLLSLRNGCFVSRPKADPPGLPILRISAVRPLALDPADVRYAPESLARACEYQVRTGDLLFTRYSGNPDYVGACAMVPPEGDGLLHPDKLIRGVPDPSFALGGWIAMVVSASVGRRQIEQRLKTTAGQVGISGSQLKSVLIPFPPLDEQAERHRRWEVGLEAMTRLRSEIEQCSARAEGARRSILAAAFSGQLVPQDPEDEPAAVLLDRIKADRVAATPTKRTRKAKAS